MKRKLNHLIFFISDHLVILKSISNYEQFYINLDNIAHTKCNDNIHTYSPLLTLPL